ncbi:MAG: flavodoxin [Dialister sp.]|nr:flavodoxin [Dialister sp.]
MIIHTFLESGDFAGKAVIPFATSGGSSINQSVDTIKKIISKANVVNGFLAGDPGDVALWLNRIGFNAK